MEGGSEWTAVREGRERGLLTGHYREKGQDEWFIHARLETHEGCIPRLTTSVHISTAGEIGELSGKTTSADVLKVKHLEERKTALIQNLYQNRSASLSTINV